MKVVPKVCQFVEDSLGEKVSWFWPVLRQEEQTKSTSSIFSFDSNCFFNFLLLSSPFFFSSISGRFLWRWLDQRAVLRAHTCAVLKERWRTSFLACITVCTGFVDSQCVRVACWSTGECQCRTRAPRLENDGYTSENLPAPSSRS